MSSTVEPSGAIEIAPIEDSSLLAFYRDMNLPERRTFWACASGWALDGMDFMIYPLVIGTIIALWKVDPGTAGLAGTVTLLASAVGGWLGGYLADRIGRVKTLQLTILWFSVFSLVCAFVQNFDQLLIARALLGPRLRRRMGRGRGADGRSDPPAISRPRGRLGAIGLGGRLGPCGAVAGDPVFLFAAGDRMALDVRDRRAAGAAGVFSAPLCRGAGDRRGDARQAERQRASGRRCGRSSPVPILKTTILASLVVTGCQGGYYAITFWVPRFLTTERKLSVVSSTGYLAALIIGSFIGYLVGAWLADRIGRRKLFLYLLARRHRRDPRSIRNCR